MGLDIQRFWMQPTYLTKTSTKLLSHFSSGLSRGWELDPSPSLRQNLAPLGVLLLYQHGIFMTELTTEIEHLE
jgi:hypothetical protein